MEKKMEKKIKQLIKQLIKQYENHMDSWICSLEIFEDGLNKTPENDTEQSAYWKDEIRTATAKIETYEYIIEDLKILNS